MSFELSMRGFSRVQYFNVEMNFDDRIIAYLLPISETVTCKYSCPKLWERASHTVRTMRSHDFRVSKKGRNH